MGSCPRRSSPLFGRRLIVPVAHSYDPAVWTVIGGASRPSGSVCHTVRSQAKVQPTFGKGSLDLSVLPIKTYGFDISMMILHFKT